MVVRDSQAEYRGDHGDYVEEKANVVRENVIHGVNVLGKAIYDTTNRRRIKEGHGRSKRARDGAM
jgi:hypothetical protein